MQREMLCALMLHTQQGNSLHIETQKNKVVLFCVEQVNCVKLWVPYEGIYEHKVV